jgi:hypothetical protein
MKTKDVSLVLVLAVVFFAGRGALLTPCTAQEASQMNTLEWIRVSNDGTHFVGADSGKRIVLWGVNYDHDSQKERLLEDYWASEWGTVVKDFQEIKALKTNVVRIHLQVAQFMDSPDTPNAVNLKRLGRLVKLAEQTGLYLDVTGLGCYHKQDVPAWYDALGEKDRWDVQARFWRAIATVCRHSPAVFCYDLMNEPILPGKKGETEWLAGELEGKYFVQRISLDLAGRTRQDLARQWVERMTTAIRAVDNRHLITVGVIPWAMVFKGAKPLFYSEQVGASLDFVSVHFYPEKDKVDAALKALAVYEIGKPLVIEEMFPLKCSLDEMRRFIEGSRRYVDGWISFYWGATIQENDMAGDIKGAVIAEWLRTFRAMSPLIQGQEQ